MGFFFGLLKFGFFLTIAALIIGVMAAPFSALFEWVSSAKYAKHLEATKDTLSARAEKWEGLTSYSPAHMALNHLKDSKK